MCVRTGPVAGSDACTLKTRCFYRFFDNSQAICFATQSNSVDAFNLFAFMITASVRVLTRTHSLGIASFMLRFGGKHTRGDDDGGECE